MVRFSLTVPPATAPVGLSRRHPVRVPAGHRRTRRPRKAMQFRSRVATLIYVNVGEPPAAVELTDLSQRVTADAPS